MVELTPLWGWSNHSIAYFGCTDGMLELERIKAWQASEVLTPCWGWDVITPKARAYPMQGKNLDFSLFFGNLWYDYMNFAFYNLP